MQQRPCVQNPWVLLLTSGSRLSAAGFLRERQRYDRGPRRALPFVRREVARIE
jgi:hypothetical protein